MKISEKINSLKYKKTKFQVKKIEDYREDLDQLLDATIKRFEEILEKCTHTYGTRSYIEGDHSEYFDINIYLMLTNEVGKNPKKWNPTVWGYIASTMQRSKDTRNELFDLIVGSRGVMIEGEEEY